MGKTLYWVPGHKDEALEAQVPVGVGRCEVMQSPGEGAERALERERLSCLAGRVAGKVPQRRTVWR